jgi:hypothetical protein
MRFIKGTLRRHDDRVVTAMDASYDVAGGLFIAFSASCKLIVFCF